MRVLVAAKRVVADRTSEGICSWKYISALAAGGHEVTCVVGEQAGTGEVRLPPSVRVVPLDNETTTALDATLSRLTRRIASFGRAGAYLGRKGNSLKARLSGHSFHVWHEVAQWRQAIRSAAAAVQPDVIVTRGAGREFEPHMAMLDRPVSTPWIAHYHDPYPGSLYPEPYRLHVPMQSPRQEQIHREIVRQCDALTFPSMRLLEWVLSGELEQHRQKAFVVPHIAGEPWHEAPSHAPALLTPQRLNLLHLGTLLRERDPRPLLRGLAQFVARHPEGDAIRLTFVGRVDRQHEDAPEWRDMTTRGIVSAHTGRVPYGAAIGLSQMATALLILEADGANSPFFPAKLADYLWTRKPIVALSPEQSVTADMLGPAYPLRCHPADEAAIPLLLERLWTAWRDDALSALAPPADRAQQLSASSVRHATEHVASFVRASRARQVA